MGCGDFEGKRAKGLDSLLRYILYTRKAVPVLLENLSKTFFFPFVFSPPVLMPGSLFCSTYKNVISIKTFESAQLLAFKGMLGHF